MPRISKLSVVELQELKSCLIAHQSLHNIGLRFHIAPASVYYYKKKFILNFVVIHRVKKPKLKSYTDYLHEWYKKIGKPYQKPPNSKYLMWL